MKNYPMKKQGFSYIELIISMGLVVMVVFLTTPFLTHLEKNSTVKFGEYRAYAKYTCKDTSIPPEKCNCSEDECDWILFQNTRRSAAEYNIEEEKPCPFADYSDDKIQVCAFILPKNISNYKVHLYGGGGEGSRPYYNEYSTTYSVFNVSKGVGGENGQFVTKLDSLAKATTNDDDSIVRIYKCEDVLMTKFPYIDSTTITVGGEQDEPKNCIGTGGYGENDDFYENTRQIYSNDIRDDIKKRFLLGKLDERHLALARTYYKDNMELLSDMREYLKAKNQGDVQEAEKYFDKLLSGNWDGGTSNVIPINISSVGNPGGDTFFRFDDNNDPAIAFGGKGGITYSDNIEEYFATDAQSLESSDGNPPEFFKYGASYIIMGTEGGFSNAGAGGAKGDCLGIDNDYNETYCKGSSPIVFDCVKNSKLYTCSEGNSRVFRFGAGGGGGAFKRTNETNGAYKYPGGFGAGGAVVIEWN